MRYLGVDLGERRTGLAISDPDGRFALPHSVLTHDSQAERLEQVLAVVREVGADVVVVGRPAGLTGQPGLAERQAVRFTGRLSSRGVRVVLWDERLTTRQARGALHEVGLHERELRPVVDQVAATLILQSYLDHINRPNG